MSKRYLTAQETADLLQISLPTLYAYVSRGFIRSEVGDEAKRTRLYLAEDVEQLLKRKELRRNPGKVAESALHFGEPVLESAITWIENGRFYYRGYDAVQLAENHTVEEVAALVWSGELTTPLFTAPLFLPHLNRYQTVAPMLTHLTTFEKFQALLPLAATDDLAGYELSQTAVMQTGVRILRLLTLAASTMPSTQGMAATLQQSWSPANPQATSLLNAALILCADHELNVSSFTARCVASARSTPYAVVMAGLAALQGHRHGGHTERVEVLFRQIGSPDQVRPTLANHLKMGEAIPGFGHPLYPDGDPRFQALWQMICAVYPHAPTLALTQAIVEEVQTAVGLLPTIDMALVTLTRVLQLPPGSALALFALGRTVGWIGHAIEQYQMSQMIRPRARYVGVKRDL